MSALVPKAAICLIKSGKAATEPRAEIEPSVFFMIRIFKQARGMTASRRRFKKYLWYSSGEIVLVVIGILIAIQVNNWNEDRIEQKQIHAYARAFASDLRDDIATIRISAYQAQIVVFQIDELVAYLQDRPFDRISNIDLYRHVGSLGYRPFAFNRAALDPMKGSGALREMRNRELARQISEYEGLTYHVGEDQTSDSRNARDAYLATNKVVNRNFPGRVAVDEYFDTASNAEHFHESFLGFPSTGLYQRIAQNDPGPIARDMREVQEMVNILISYRNDLYPRPDHELPGLLASAQAIIDVIEAEYPEE
ncbi:MAG: DUF6090 family protein [Gammaproteobacteria bacterium]|nr:DUF6090 family protein [Gammaproteobacteria bacterium]MDH4254004.1 DUF6090 family protein [Gammaproteobacteria bacterium]